MLFVVLFVKPLGGWLSDITGRRRLMMGLTVATMALILPALHSMMEGTLTSFFWGQVMLAVPLGMALGLQGAMVVEIFPLRTRVTSMSDPLQRDACPEPSGHGPNGRDVADGHHEAAARTRILRVPVRVDRPRDYVANKGDEYEKARSVMRPLGYIPGLVNKR